MAVQQIEKPAAGASPARKKSAAEAKLRLRAQQLGKLLFLLFAAVVVLGIHGYHPYADDAALYVAGIKYLHNPHLYTQVDLPFLKVHATSSIFEPLMAGIATRTGASVDSTLFAAYIVSAALYIFAVYRLARLLFGQLECILSACLLAAAAFTLPVAGTSLSLMDPYLTARSFATPVFLFSLEAQLRGRTLPACCIAILVCLLHPVLGLSFLLFQALLWICMQPGGKSRILLLLAAAGCFTIAFAAADALSHARPDSLQYQRVVWTRTYLFLGQWKWFEYLGIAAPLALSGYAWNRLRQEDRRRGLLAAIVVSGVLITALCSVFVGPSQSLLLARAQMMRIFLPIYLAGTVMLGGWLGSLWRDGRRIAVCFPILVAAALFWSQKEAFQRRTHVESPFVQAVNPWHQAFLWIRRNTPGDAVFAGNPHMIELPTEGQEGFRAAAERSMLADDKDGGVATLSPSLAERWTNQFDAQENIASETDEERFRKLSPYGVTWILLPPPAATSLECPYRNQVVKVCRLNLLER